MNIFVLHNNPSTCAKYHGDRHVIKMILESAQMLCTAHWVSGGSAPYKKTHYNHPCNVWVRDSISNYRWLCKLAKQLCKEYTFRYGKIHKTESIIDWLNSHEPKLPDKKRTKFALAMPDEYKTGDVISSYRGYYREEKKHLHSYKGKINGRNLPEFLTEV